MWESATLGMSECNAWILRVCLGAMAHATEKRKRCTAITRMEKNSSEHGSAFLRSTNYPPKHWFSAFLVLFSTLISQKR